MADMRYSTVAEDYRSGKSRLYSAGRERGRGRDEAMGRGELLRWIQLVGRYSARGAGRYVGKRAYPKAPEMFMQRYSALPVWRGRAWKLRSQYPFRTSASKSR